VPDRNRSLPKLTVVSDEQLAAINRIHLNFPYNFGPAPRPETKISLAEFVRDCEKEFPYAILDLVDKLNLDSFSAESFDHHIDRNLLATPGHLSAVTVAKLIQYCLQILESESEMITGSGADLGVVSMPNAHDIATAMAVKVNRYKHRNKIPEYDHVGQFLSAIRHPVVGKAVSNAAINRWGTGERGELFALFW
jgi:hypothetical protein